MSQIEVDRGGFQSFFGYVSDDAGETFSQTFTATGNAITHLTFPVDLDTSSTATMRVLIADVTGGAIGAILYDSGTISIAPVPGESLSYGGGPFRDINLDMNVATIPGHQYVILFDGLPDADGSDRIVLGWNPDSTYAGGSAGYWFADPSVGLSFASNNALQGDYAFTMTFADANVINGTPGDDRGDTALIGTNGDDIINGFAGNDELFGLGGNDVLNGDEGHDALRGAAGNDTLNGGDGDDFLNGGIGDDVVNGGAGFDRATFASGAVAGVTVDLNLQGVAQNTGQGMDTLTGIEHVSGTAFDDTLTGDGGDNWIWGQGGNDVLTGNGGNDLIQAGAPGNLTADGGSGTDTLSVNDNGAGSPGVTVSLALQGGAQATGIGSYTLSGFENLSGSSGNDTLTGDGGTNVLAGDQGDDLLSGGGGDDTLYGDGQFGVDTHGTGGSGPITTLADGATADPTFVDGNDTLDGGAGNDILNGGGGNDTASFASSTEAVFASLNNSGNGSAENFSETEFDQLISIENLTGSAFNDQLIGNIFDNVLSGGDGDDFLFGRGGNDTLLGGNGDDFFRNGVGDDVVSGGAGFDRMSSYGSGLATGVHVDLNLQGVAQDTGHGMDTLTGIEALSGTDFDDTLIGDDNNNWLLAADGNDTLIGNGGNDLLDDLDGELGAASGNHIFDGGSGIDTVGFSGMQLDPDGVTVSLALQGGGQDSGHGILTISNVENLSGSMHDDVLTGDGNANTLSGHAGSDSLVGGDGDDSLYGDGALVADTRPTGGSGPITFFSDVTAFDPSLVDGNDTLEGGAGNDTLDGGGGSDTASYEHNGGPVDIELQFGVADEYAADGVTYLSSDTLVSIENVIGSAFDDVLVGNDSDNALDGRDGNDFVQGLGGNDTLHGGAGNDTLFGDRGDAFIGLSGNDVIYGEGGNDVLRGGLGDDQLYGGDNNDLMRGNGGVDSFDGGADDGEGFNGIGDRVSFFEVRATQGAVADLRTGIISNDGYGNVETMVNIESLGGDTAFADTFYGNDARNFLFADLGDSAYGFGGNDVFQIASAAAIVDGGDGVDQLNLVSSGGWLTPDTNADGLAESVGAASEGWFVNLLGGFVIDGYGNFGNVTGIENVSGSELADNIRGDNNDNVLSGLGGDDTLVGNGGNDILDGGDGDDLIRGDQLTYTGGPFGNDTLIGGGGNDLMRGSAGVDSYDGGSDSGGEGIYGGIGDRISFYEVAATSGVVADLRTGIISNDGFGNVETMVGIESLGGDTAFIDTFYGNDGRNTLLGGRGDQLYGFGGDDQFSLAAAAGIVDGGDGIDVLRVNSAGGWLSPDTNADGLAETIAAASNGWTINLAAGSLVDGYGNSGTITGVENVDGSELDDTLIGDDNANVLNGLDGNDTLEGRGGDDTLDGGSGTDTVSYVSSATGVEVDLGAGLAFEYAPDGITIVSTDTLANIENATGSAFADALSGSGGDNVLQGLGGDDLILGGQGDDQIDGGAGFDTAAYFGASGAVTVNLATGTSSGADGNDSLTGIEALSGSNFDDTLIGDDGANSLTGRTGNDTLIGGGGDDFLRGGAGNDVMDGGSGFDRVSHYGTNITHGVTVDLRIVGAQDTGHGLDTYIGIEALSGSRYDDTLIGDDNNNWLIAADGTDTLVGNGGNDLLTVADGELAPASGNHNLDGGAGSDTVDVSWIALGVDGVTLSLALQGGAQDSGHGMLTLNNIENLSGTFFSDVLTGDGNANTLSGNAGSDVLSGGAGDDALYGDGAMVADTRNGNGGSGPITFFADVTAFDPSLVDGNDTLEGGAGNDTLNGGGGSDTASYEHNAGRVEAFLGNSGFGGADEYAADGVTLLSSDFLQSIENLTGSAFDDILSGNNGANILLGLGGNDNLLGLQGNDTLDGGDGNDTLRGDNGLAVGNDTLLGGNGNDFLNGGNGNDTIDGGAGYDRATFFTAALAGVHVDLNLQGVAQDTGQGMDTLLNIENVSGTAYGDTLIGDNNNNWLWGSPSTDGVNPPTGSNNDTLDGGGGNDLLTVGTGNHSLTGGTGIDTVSFTENGGIPDPSVTVSLALQGAAQATGAGNWTLNGIENLSGGTNNDSLTGDGNDNVLAGDQGNDTLVGGGGNDTLYGDGRIGIDYAGGPGTSGPIATFADGATADPTFVDGNDTLEGGLGNDTLNGGGGSDTASYAHASGDVQATIGAGGSGGSSGADGNDTFVSIENLTGGAFNDQLVGNGQANVLSGGDGHDLLRGGGGNDTLLGGNGDDFLNGGFGDDTIDGGAGWDRATFATGAVAGVTVDLTLQGIAQNTGQGMDTLINIENVSGTSFNDTLTGDGGDNWIWGQGGNDVLTGNGGNDLIQAGAPGNLTASGGTGTDTLSVSNNDASGAGVTVSLALQGAGQATGIGTYTLTGFENLSGSSGNDTLTGDGGSNVLAGDQGDDTLVGGAGNDTLYGDGQIGTDGHGLGLSGPITTIPDVASLGGVSGNDTLEGGLGNDTLNGGGGTDTASYANASGSVTVDLTAGTATGADGNDTLTSIENVTGSAFNDQLTGSSAANVLNGGAGNDTLNGRAGNDTLVGGTGTDTATYANASGGVTVSLVAGTASGADGNDTLATIENVTGSAFADTITGDGNVNVLTGGDGDDTLNGRAGNDTLIGGNGVDTASYADASGAVNVNLSTGSATGADGSDSLSTIENVTGSAFADTLRGDDNANVLKGGDGSDAILGGRGDDTIYGGHGNDTLSGNQGNDRYVIETGSGTDHVTDFAPGGDKVVFSGIAGVDDITDLTITKVGSNTVITWGTADSLTLDGIRPNQLNASDFQFAAAASFAAAAAPLNAKDGSVGPSAESGSALHDQLFDVSRIAPAATALHGLDQVASTFSADLGAIAQSAEGATANSAVIHFEFSPDLGISGSDPALVHHDAGATII